MNRKILQNKTVSLLLCLLVVLSNMLPVYSSAHGNITFDEELTSAREAALKVENVTADSIQLDVIYKVDAKFGNCMSLHEIGTDNWSTFQPNLYLKSGSYQFNGLKPDTLYEVILAWLEDGNWYNMSTSMKTSKPEVSTDNLMNRAPVLKVYEKKDTSILWDVIFPAGGQDNNFDVTVKNPNDWENSKLPLQILYGKLNSFEMKPDTEYQAVMYWFDKTGKFFSVQLLATTEPPLPYIKVQNVTAHSIEWELKYRNNNEAGNSFSVLNTKTQERKVYEPDGYLTNGSKLSDNLTPDTEYIGVLGWYDNGWKSISQQVKTLPTPTPTPTQTSVQNPTPTSNTSSPTPRLHTPEVSNSVHVSPNPPTPAPVNPASSGSTASGGTYLASVSTPTPEVVSITPTPDKEVSHTVTDAVKTVVEPEEDKGGYAPKAASDIREFEDVPKEYWARKYIYEMTRLGIFSGKGSKKTFKPSDNLTRAECITAITKLFHIYDEHAEVSLSDVKNTDWHYKYIASAFRAGFVMGRDDGKFAPLENITRQDLCVILSRIMKNKYPQKIKAVEENNEDPHHSVKVKRSRFVDEHAISGYAKESVAMIVKLNLVKGKPGNMMDPLGKTTRAELAKMLYEIYINFEKNKVPE